MEPPSMEPRPGPSEPPAEPPAEWTPAPEPELQLGNWGTGEVPPTTQHVMTSAEDRDEDVAQATHEPAVEPPAEPLELELHAAQQHAHAVEHLLPEPELEPEPEQAVVQATESLTWEEIAELPPPDAARYRAKKVLHKQQAERLAAGDVVEARTAALRKIEEVQRLERASSPRKCWVSPHAQSTFAPLPSRTTVYSDPMERRVTGRRRHLDRGQDADGRVQQEHSGKSPGKFAMGGMFASDSPGPGAHDASAVTHNGKRAAWSTPRRDAVRPSWGAIWPDQIGSGTPPVGDPSRPRRTAVLPGSPAKPTRYEAIPPDVYPSASERRAAEKKRRKMATARLAAEQYRHHQPGSESLSTKGSAALNAPKFGAPVLPGDAPPPDPDLRTKPKVSERAEHRVSDMGLEFKKVSLAPPAHAPVAETSMRLMKQKNKPDGGYFQEVRLSESTRMVGAQPAWPGGVPTRLIKEKCRDNNSVGPAPVVYSPGPGGYHPVYSAPNKQEIGMTAEKIIKQMSTRAGRLRAKVSGLKHQDFGAPPRFSARQGPTRTPGWMGTSILRVAPWSQWRGEDAATVPVQRRAAPDVIELDLKIFR